MKRTIAIFSATLLAAFTLSAQGRGHGAAPAGGPQHTSSGGVHTNAPAGTQAASADRDFGRDRAEDVGRGKKKGLKKQHNKQKKQKHQEAENRK
jgi:hypothetical protein